MLGVERHGLGHGHGHGQEARESAKSGLEITVANALSDKGYTGMFEIRHLSKEAPLQVTFCDASSNSVLYETKAANNVSLPHQQAEDEEMQKQQHVVSEESPEDINVKWQDSLPLWYGWKSSDAETMKKPPELPLRSHMLYVEGNIKGSSCYVPPIRGGGSIPWNGGPLTFAVGKLESLATTCKRVLLVPDEDTRRIVASFVGRDDYLVVQVGWDAESYLFLRKLDKFVPGLTFIAITDLDPHHLDRLAFLASPASEVWTHYGWDLSKECQLTGVDEDTALDIKWLGLRPSDIEPHVACFKAFARRQAEADFDTVIKRLLTIPSVTKNEEWKDELQRLQDCRLFLPFSVLKPRYIKDVYVPQKLNKEDWV